AAPNAIAPPTPARRAVLDGALRHGSMMRSQDLELCECTRPSSEADTGTCPQDRCVLDTGDGAAVVEAILEVRLDRPAGIDLVGIANLEQRLVIARHRLAEIDIGGRD